jgi:hypothetical protein
MRFRRVIHILLIKLQFTVYDVERPLVPRVNLRIRDGFGEVGDDARLLSVELFAEYPALEEDLRRVSARISSKLTLRSEDVGVTEVSRISVNLEMAMTKECFD